MLLLDLLINMGVGASFSTAPILATLLFLLAGLPPGFYNANKLQVNAVTINEQIGLVMNRNYWFI